MTTKLERIKARLEREWTRRISVHDNGDAVCVKADITETDEGLLLAVAEAAAALGPDVFDDIRTLLGDVLRLTAAHPIMLALDALDAAIAPLLVESAAE